MDINNVLPIWLYDANYRMIRIYHYGSIVSAPLLRVENWIEKKDNLLHPLISNIKKQLVKEGYFDNKIVIEVEVQFTDKHFILYFGYKDNDFIVGLSMENHSMIKPTMLDSYHIDTCNCGSGWSKKDCPYHK